MITLFKEVIVINKKKYTPDYSFINGDYFSDEKNWLELFNREKDIQILIENDIEYMKFVIKFYKTILENITEKELYTLYHLSLCLERIKPKNYNEFVKYYNEEKYNLSNEIKYKIYPELPIEFFVSTLLSGNRNEIIIEKMKNIFNEYIDGLYSRCLRIQNENISLFKKYNSDDFNNLFNDLDKNYGRKIDIDTMVNEVRKSVLEDDISYKIVGIVRETMDTNDLIKPFLKDIEYLNINPYSDVLINELNNFDFYNKFVIYYIYKLFQENNIETLKRISLTWI